MSVVFKGGDVFSYQGVEFPISILDFTEVDDDGNETPVYEAIYVVDPLFSGRIIFGGSQAFAVGAAFEDNSDAGVVVGVTWQDMIETMVGAKMLKESVLNKLQSDGEALVNHLIEKTPFEEITETFKDFVANRFSEES